MLTAAAYMIFALAMGVLAFTRHPIYGFYLYLATMYVHPPSRWWGYMVPDLRWAMLAAVVTALAILFNHRRLAPKPMWLSSVPAVLLTLYALWMWIQLPWAALDVEDHQRGSGFFTKYLIAFWFVYRIVDSKDRLRDLLTAHALGCGLLGFYAYETGREGDRLDGVGGPGIDDSNTLGMYFATGIIACLVLILTQRGWRRYLMFVVVAFIANGLVLTNSRGPLLGLLAGLLVVAVCIARAHRMLFWSLAAAGALSVGSLIDQHFIDRMLTIGHAVEGSAQMDSSARSRVELYHAQLRMFATHPMGIGHRGTATLSPHYLDHEWLTVDETGREDTAARSSHNTFMTALVEQGVPGAFLYLALVGWLVWIIVRIWSWRSRAVDSDLVTYAAGLAAALIVIFVAGMSTDYLLAENQFWFFAALVSVVQMSAVGSGASRKEAVAIPSGSHQGAGYR